MAIFLGILLVLTAAFLQGTFVLPMKKTKNWAWEHTWFTFSVLGMVIFNWIITLILIPNVFEIFASVPFGTIVILLLFGAGWGLGAVFFGIGMDKLGLSLGYPIIMGLIAGMGTFIPMALFFPQTLITLKGALVLFGVLILIIAIVVCSKAGALKEKASESKSNDAKFKGYLLIGIAGGLLSCLTNVGIAYADPLIEAAAKFNVSKSMAANTVWPLFFSAGFIVNMIYCLTLMKVNKNGVAYRKNFTIKNFSLAASIAIMWIGSFYLYAFGALKMGKWGLIIGWPILMALSILVGNLWGVKMGEWKGAQKKAILKFKFGLLLLLVAIVFIAVSNLV